MKRQFWKITAGLILALSATGGGSDCQADDQDLILMMSLSTETPLTAAEIHGLIDDAILPGEEVKGISVTSVPRRLYDRFARMIGKRTNASAKADERIRQVSDELFKWHIKGFGTSPDTPKYAPDWVVLKWKQYSPEGMATEHTQEFPVVAPSSTDTTAVVQSLQGDNQTLLVRADESWEVLGYRMEWKGTGDSRLQDPPDNGFHPWNAQPPSFLVVVPKFEQYGKPLKDIYDALRGKVSETLEINSPERPLKLVALDLEPVDRGIGSPYFQSYYALRLAKSREALASSDPLAWALFPLTTAQKDEYLAAIAKEEVEHRNDPGAGARAIPAYIENFRESQTSTGYVPVADALEEVPALTARKLEQPTAVLDSQLAPQWYEVPAVTDQASRATDTDDPAATNGNVKYYSRTLKLNQVSHEFGDAKAWAVVVYARAVADSLRAGKLATEQPDAGPEYAVAVEVPFVSFLKSVAETPTVKEGQ